jgi:hypothetical protein
MQHTKANTAKKAVAAESKKAELARAEQERILRSCRDVTLHVLCVAERWGCACRYDDVMVSANMTTNKELAKTVDE